ncbi:MAG: hypothetical protein ABI459_07350 [Deltaproteobacteria bacterium]
MPPEAQPLSTAFADFCNDYLDRVAAQTRQGGTGFRAGLARFTLHEGVKVVTPWAVEQFETVTPEQDDPQIYLVYDDLPDHPIVALMNRIGYHAVEALLAEIGCTGFYHSDTRHLEFYNPARRIGLRVLPDITACPVWERTAPLANFVAWTNAGLGGFMLHAATLANRSSGALICGRGGRGKSLMTLAGVAAGLDSVGDDYVVVSRAGHGYQAVQCARTAKQTPKGLDMLGAWGESLKVGELNWQGKHVFQLPVRAANQPLQVNAIVVPTIAATTQITPIKRGDVFRHLTESTLYQLAGNQKAVSAFCAGMIRDLPVFGFDMGPDLAVNAAHFDRFLREQVAG